VTVRPRLKFWLIVLPPQSDKIVEYLLSVLKADENAEIHACVCIGLAKLLLSGMVTNTNVRALYRYPWPLDG
jgi:hypothetical protein